MHSERAPCFRRSKPDVTPPSLRCAVRGSAPLRRRSDVIAVCVVRENRRRGCVSSKKASVFRGSQSHQGKSQDLVAWIAERRETEFLRPIDKAIFKGGEQAIGPQRE